MADLDPDELERHLLNVSRTSRLADDRGFSDAVDALLDAAPALIAAARAAQHRGETLERVAEAVGYPQGAHYGDVLGRIDEIVAERDRLRAAVDAVLADVARWREHTEARARGGQHVGTGGEIGNLSPGTAAYLERVLRAAGGGT